MPDSTGITEPRRIRVVIPADARACDPRDLEILVEDWTPAGGSVTADVRLAPGDIWLPVELAGGVLEVEPDGT